MVGRRRRGGRPVRSADGTPDAPPDDGSPARPSPPRDPLEVAREICLNQLAVRPRTRAELAAALQRRGVADDVAAAVLDRYDEVGIIDDQAFAHAWVSSRHHGRGLARRALASELRRKGVDTDAVGAALAEVDDETEAGTARTLVDRKLRLDRGTDPAVLFRRLVGMLGRKGYPPGLAVRVVKEALAERAESSGFADGVEAESLVDAMEAQALAESDG